MRLLIFFPVPEKVRTQLRDRLAAAFPDLTINIAENFATASAHIASADIFMGYHITNELAAEAKALKWVQSLGTGVDGFLGCPALRKDAIITRVHGLQAPPVAEAVLGLMFALSRQLAPMIRAQDRNLWHREPSVSVRLLAGKTAGILGVGRIAEELAPKLKALGLSVIGLSGRADVAGFDRIYPRSDLLRVVGTFDFLVALVPLSDATRHIVDATVLAAMKPTAYLINVARGMLVDETALIEALTAGRIAGAALDVFSQEPLPPESLLWSAPNLIVTPHVSAMYDAYVGDIMPVLDTNMRCFLSGDTQNMINVVTR